MRNLFLASSFLSLAMLAVACGSSVESGTGGGGTGGALVGGSSTGGSTAVDYSACADFGECSAIGTGCCGVCGYPEASDFAGVNNAYVDLYFQQVCPEPIPCPACPTAVNLAIVAYCDQGQGKCEVVDVGTCTVNSDCRLRNGMGCCEACAAPFEQLVAVSQEPTPYVCSPYSGACAPCVPTYFPGASAACDNGHCVVVEPK